MSIFGTDGIRNQVGIYPFTPESLIKLGYGIGKWAYGRYGKAPIFLLAHDTRLSCSWIKAALKTGLLMHPSTLFDAQVLPTPALFHLMKGSEYSVGIVISASHNPYTDNGIKLITAEGTKLSESDEVSIEQFMSAYSSELISYQELGIEQQVADAQEIYQQKLVALAEPQYLSGIKIVLDCAHGATYQVAPAIFKALGAQILTIGCDPNGKNINDHCGALYPQELQQAVIENKADIGFAFDGDGDRLIAVNRLGQIKDGDDLLAMLSNHPAYSHLSTLVGTQMSNQGLEVYLAQRNKQLVRTAVGDKYVAQALLDKQTLLGGEQSGHIILHDHIRTGDGILVALKIIETILITNNWDMHSFTKFPQVLLNVPIRSKKDLSQGALADVILESRERLVPGRLLVRYSGTENYLRIMAEASSQEIALSISNDLAQKLYAKLQ